MAHGLYSEWQTKAYLVDDSTCNYDIVGLMRRAPTYERRQKKCVNKIMVLTTNILFYTLMTLFFMYLFIIIIIFFFFYVLPIDSIRFKSNSPSWH